MKDRSPVRTQLLTDWESYINRAAASHKPAITTLESFGGNAELLRDVLSYAQECGVDVMVAAQSDGSF